MPEYRITWEIELNADSPREAAAKALAIQRDPDSIATVFDVTDKMGNTVRIDLDEAEDGDACAACGCPLDDAEDAIHAPNGRSYCRECFDQGQG